MRDTLLRAARLRAGLSQARLGEAVYSTREAVSEWERGIRPMADEVRMKAARTLNAPELILDDMQVLFEGGAHIALSWVIEEFEEALPAARRQEERMRKGETCDLLDEQLLWQPRTAIASYMVARSRQGADVFAMRDRHLEHLTKRGYLGRRRGAA